MGLDMCLNRMPRYKDATASDVCMVENFLDWLKSKFEGSEYAKCSFEKWCGSEKFPSPDYLEFYADHYKATYSEWDKEKKHPWWRISEEVGYWRKANQIHNWFVENIQDGEDDCCYHREVTKEDLEELLMLCERIKNIAIMEDGKVSNGYCYQNGERVEFYEDGAQIVNADEIAKLLPTQSGFFFGGTDYDSYYMGDIEDTIDIITKVLETTDFNTQMIYYVSSW